MHPEPKKVRARKVALKQLVSDERAQARQSIAGWKVAEYAEEMAAGAEFPSVVVFHDGDTYWVADGHHRAEAARQAGFTSIACQVHRGSLRDAILYSCGANAEHGWRRSSDCKRIAVKRLLGDAEWSRWSSREIARRCRVSASLVDTLRKEATIKAAVLTARKGSEIDERTYLHKTGVVTTMRMRIHNTMRTPERPVELRIVPKVDPLQKWAPDPQVEQAMVRETAATGSVLVGLRGMAELSVDPTFAVRSLSPKDLQQATVLADRAKKWLDSFLTALRDDGDGKKRDSDLVG